MDPLPTDILGLSENGSRKSASAQSAASFQNQATLTQSFELASGRQPCETTPDNDYIVFV
jgi:hypothetical protein